MSDDKDPLEILTESWRRMDAPSIDGDDVALDAETREAIATMRRAWRSLKVEVPPIAARRRHPVLRRFATVAAAAVLLFTAIGIAVLPRDIGSKSRVGSSKDNAMAMRVPTPNLSPTEDSAAPSRSPNRSIKVIESNNERSVLQCGNTRLVLLNMQVTSRP